MKKRKEFVAGDIYVTKGGWKAKILYVWEDDTNKPGVLCLHYIPNKNHQQLCQDFSAYPHTLHNYGPNNWDNVCLCVHYGKVFEGFMGNGEDQVPTKHYADNPKILDLKQITKESYGT